MHLANKLSVLHFPSLKANVKVFYTAVVQFVELVALSDYFSARGTPLFQKETTKSTFIFAVFYDSCTVQIFCFAQNFCILLQRLHLIRDLYTQQTKATILQMAKKCAHPLEATQFFLGLMSLCWRPRFSAPEILL